MRRACARADAPTASRSACSPIHFDWEPQARAIVKGVRLSESEKARTRVLLVDADKRVIAASDEQGILSERIQLDTGGRKHGFYHDGNGHAVAFHETPGYETYAGLGWYGVILQESRLVMACASVARMRRAAARDVRPILKYLNEDQAFSPHCSLVYKAPRAAAGHRPPLSA